MDAKKIRGDFPILESGVIYMDNAATSLTPEQVVMAEQEYYRHYNANIHRGVHALSQISSQHYELVYEKVAKLIGSMPEEIVFTKNTTEGINLIARGLEWKKGDKVVVTIAEHHSNFLPWLRLKRYGVDLEIVNCSNEGTFDVSDFENVVDEKTRVIALSSASNVLGSILPAEEIGKIAKDNDALFLIDAAQSVPHMETDIDRLNCDFLAFSGHKMLASTGVGVLYVKKELQGMIEPLQLGGGSVQDVDIEGYTLKKSSRRFEAGTPPIAQIIGLGAAIDYLMDTGYENIEKHEKKLTKIALKGLNGIEGIEVYGPPAEKRIGVISFNIRNLDPHEVAFILSQRNIMMRSGYHCCLPLMKFLGLNDGAVRASLYLYNTMEEVETFISVIGEIARELS
ncbi:MAG: hypothetical protein A7316_07335 [Candidatus Altiarchaeales archaeon WOR_SM1_86-2]|nr:MAG: hypothetical protein A7316_07335 [Candidatus Altiarchaeales archaeon WOR_SM1_86-2]ODS40071.1 MAG: hypothetical protein A7315_09715 [Candidatus Altiarchaeales archaeon WOR_SM1_79]